MAFLEIKIKDAQFNAGGRFENMSKNSTAIVLGLNIEGNQGLSITNNLTTIEDFQFRPNTHNDKEDIYTLINGGIIEIAIGGTPQTPAQLSALMATFYQDI